MLADFVVDSSGDAKRTDKSLGILTRKFVQILQKTSNGVLDLKYVSAGGVCMDLSFGHCFVNMKYAGIVHPNGINDKICNFENWRFGVRFHLTI